MLSKLSAADEQFMDAALTLAKRGLSWTNPNPMVGAVIVKNGKIIGRGYHRKIGSLHAEIEAINSVGTNLEDATLYVNLEPCTHYGRTPPCVDAIIGSGISRVVCATADPNPEVAGRGLEQLRTAGLEVAVGPRSEAAKKLNEAFFTFHDRRRPFIALKFAASLDGKIATRTGDSKWITNEQARAFARSLRSEYQAILVGIKTVLRDDPQLGTRQPGKKDPLRIIVDSRLQVPLDSQVLRDNNILIATTNQAPGHKQNLLEQRGVQIMVFAGKTVPVSQLLAALARQEIISILIEGGGQILGSFIDARTIDKVYAFYAPLLIGGTSAVSIEGNGVKEIQAALCLKKISFKHFHDNFLVSGYPEI